MKLKIISDGTASGTRIASEDGELLENVTAVSWSFDANTGVAQARVDICNLGAEIVVTRMRDRPDANKSSWWLKENETIDGICISRVPEFSEQRPPSTGVKASALWVRLEEVLVAYDTMMRKESE